MDIQKRLLRRPLTTALWTVISVIMAMMLSVGSAVMYSSGSLAGILDQYHTSIAVNTDPGEYTKITDFGELTTFEDRKLFQEDVDYLLQLDSVKDIYFQTLTGGYSESFTPIIAAQRYSYDNETYFHAMAAGKVTKIYQMEDLGYPIDMTSVGMSETEPYYQCYLEIEVEKLVLYNSSFMKEEKVTHLNMDFLLVGQEAATFFQEGERYIFFGKNDPKSNAYFQNMRPCNWLSFRYESAVKDGQLYKASWDFTPVGAERAFSLPVAAKLEGSVEEFLADPKNAQWAQMADSWNKLQHSLPVIGTESVEAMYAFVTKSADLAQGRFITQEEYDVGAKVCMLSTTLAEQSGIAVGETITLSQFLCGNNAWGPDRNDSLIYTTESLLNNPTAGAYVADLEFVTEDETFEVVGLYRYSNEWENTSYSFTPNTVFIPQKAQAEGAYGGMSRQMVGNAVDENGQSYNYSYNESGATFGLYLTILLHNGKVSQFKADLTDTKYAGWFLTADQGYEKILGGLNAMTGSARRLLYAVATGWVLLLALYVLLYQGTQRKNMGIMRSQGATPRQVCGYLFGSGMVPVLLGVCVGTAASALVIERVQQSLVAASFGQAVLDGGIQLDQQVLESMLVQSQLPGWMLPAMGVGQLLLIGLILGLQAVILSGKTPRALLRK